MHQFAVWRVSNGSCVTSTAGPHGDAVTVREMKEFLARLAARV
jgi:hypothetical protein